MTTRSTLKQVGGSTKGRWETCRQLRQGRGPTCRQLRHRRQSGTKPIGRRAIGILSILQALTTDEFFHCVRTDFGLFGEKHPANRRGSVNSTPTNTARTELHTAWSHFITRTRVADDLEDWLHIFVSLNNCHPRVMSHSLLHLTLTTSTSSLTRFVNFSYLSDSLTNTHKIYGPRTIFTLRSSTAEWRINTNPISHSFPSQNSTVQGTDTLEYRMSSFCVAFHHFCTDGIPFSLRCFVESSVPLLFVSVASDWPVCSREPLRVILDVFRIRNALFWICCLRPINVIEHWHEDNSTFKMSRFNFFWSCRSFGIIWKIANEVKSWEIFHSNSIGSQSIPKNSV